MLLEFAKLSGAGNDFLLLDNRAGKIKLSREQVARLCHRQFGVGADGLILLVPAAGGQSDWAWDFYNNDGSDAEMCGNGARCFARFVEHVTGSRRNFTFDTIAGRISAVFDGDRITVNLTQPKDLRLNQTLPLSTGSQVVHSVNTGVPHAIVYVADLAATNVVGMGREIRRHPHFAPKGTNVNFVQVMGSEGIQVRTYERGVEDETLACGTGVSACALVTAKLHGFASPVQVRVRGGDLLKVSFDEQDGEYRNVRLNGPAELVFEGKVELK